MGFAVKRSCGLNPNYNISAKSVPVRDPECATTCCMSFAGASSNLHAMDWSKSLILSISQKVRLVLAEKHLDRMSRVVNLSKGEHLARLTYELIRMASFLRLCTTARQSSIALSSTSFSNWRLDGEASD